MRETETRCGFISVVGLPNAGKSTLINTLVGGKVSIVSHKAHTTRMRVLGIFVHEQSQIVLIDTPGVFDAKKTLERAMVGAAYEALDESDSVLHILDASDKKAVARNKDLIEKLPKNKPVFLALNKTDKVQKPELLKLAQALTEQFDYHAIFMISAIKHSGLKDMLGPLAGSLPVGPWHFAEDEMTDLPMRMMAAEITREKIFKSLHQELPYATMVHTENWEEFDNGSIKIDQVIYVQRPSQKAIVLGKGGAQIKRLGQEARTELEEIFEARVHLKLFVKVQENWTERPENLRLMGLRE